MDRKELSLDNDGYFVEYQFFFFSNRLKWNNTSTFPYGGGAAIIIERFTSICNIQLTI